MLATGAEAALVVNNCAGAVLLLLAATTAAGPWSCRAASGSRLRRFPGARDYGRERLPAGRGGHRLADYQRALDAHPDAAALLRVHQGTSLAQLGFVERPELASSSRAWRGCAACCCSRIGRRGRGRTLGQAGFPGEPMIQAGARSAVAFSTDKVLGGPQGWRDRWEQQRSSTGSASTRSRAPRLGDLAMAHAPLHQLEARVAGWAREAPRGVLCQVTPSETESAARAPRARCRRWRWRSCPPPR